MSDDNKLKAMQSASDICEQQAAQRDTIRQMMHKTGLDATGLARAAGLAPSTVSRFLNQPVDFLLTTRTLGRLARVSGVSVPGGGPIAMVALTGPERELLEAFRSTDRQGRTMMLRFGRALRNEAPAEREAAE